MTITIPSLATIVHQLKGYTQLSPVAVGGLDQWIVTPEIALEGIGGLCLHATILHLYQQLFPEEYEASTKSSQYEAGVHSPKEIEFFSWVDERLFQLPYYDAYDELMSEIPIYSINSEWWEMWIGDLDLALVERVLLAFCGQWGEFYQTLPSDIQQQVTPYLAPISEVDVEQLERIYHHETSPARYLCECLDLLGYNTGNPFLDNTMMDYREGVGWSLSNVQRLAEQYRAAQDRLQQVHELEDWLNEDLPTHLNRLAKLWNQCALRGVH
jgi:hypothetical protein